MTAADDLEPHSLVGHDQLERELADLGLGSERLDYGGRQQADARHASDHGLAGAQLGLARQGISGEDWIGDGHRLGQW